MSKGATRELQAVLGMVDLASSDDTARSRFATFDAVATFLRSQAENSPLLLVLEDLHWAEHDSLTLLGFIASSMAVSRIFILCTVRTHEASSSDGLSTSLSRLARHDRFIRIELSPLNLSESAALLRTVIPDPAVEALIPSIFELMEGNPFFTLEIARLVQGQHTEGEILIPETVRGTMTDRLRGLSPDTLHVLCSAWAAHNLCWTSRKRRYLSSKHWAPWVACSGLLRAAWPLQRRAITRDGRS